MNANASLPTQVIPHLHTPRTPRTQEPLCPACGTASLQLDEVSHGGPGAALLLGQCGHCDHRFTSVVTASEPSFRLDDSRDSQAGRGRTTPPRRGRRSARVADAA